MRRKPGAQPNNKNAFKHGFYSKYFSPFESRALSKTPLMDISSEISLLRVNVDRFMESYVASLDRLDYDSRLVGLRAITLAVGRIAALQRILSTASRNFAESEKIRKAIEELEFDDPSAPSGPAPAE